MVKFGGKLVAHGERTYTKSRPYNLPAKKHPDAIDMHLSVISFTGLS